MATELTYDQASANLAKSGLTGKSLSDAQASLKSHYGAVAAAPTSTAPTTAPTAPTDTGGSNTNDAFIGELQKSLLKQSGMISSADSNIEKSINDAIGSINKGNAAGREQIMSEYDRNRGYQMDANANSEQSFFEARSGYATPTVAFANLREYNAKTIKDLDQRKNELILQGDAAAAGKIAELQIQKLTFEQEAARRTFTNLLATGSFALNVQQGQLATKAQTFQENQALSAIALQYGLKMEPGETLDSLVNKAMPLASQEQKLKLEQMRSQINQNNAQTQAALAAARKSAREDAPLDAASIAALASAYRTPGGAAIVAATIKDPKTLGAIFAGSTAMQNSDVSAYVKTKIAAGFSLEDTIANLSSDPSIAITDPTAAAATAAATYANTPAPAPKKWNSFPQVTAGAAKSYSGSVNNFLEWLTGA